MLLLYLLRLKNRNLKHLEQQLNSGFLDTELFGPFIKQIWLRCVVVQFFWLWIGKFGKNVFFLTSRVSSQSP